jgi:small-conductance mechanosensitive channel
MQAAQIVETTTDTTGVEQIIPQVSTHMETYRDIFVRSFTDAFDQIARQLPNVLAMVVVIVAGYFIARLLARAVETLAEALGLQTAAQRSGLSQSMTQAGITRTIPWIVGQIMFWLTMCVFLSAGFNILGLDTVSSAMQEVVAYIPNLLVATVVVVIGLLVAQFVRGVIATSADRLGLNYADTLATACYWVLALMTFVAAFEHLGLKFELLKEMVLIAFGAVGLAFGLSVGLGGRDVMGGILAGYYTRQRLHPGDRVSVAGMEGKVREVGPVATIIETEEGGLLNRHSVPNTKMLSEAVR